jgi:hypothetical protein
MSLKDAEDLLTQFTLKQFKNIFADDLKYKKKIIHLFKINRIFTTHIHYISIVFDPIFFSKIMQGRTRHIPGLSPPSATAQGRGGLWTAFIWVGTGPVMSSCEHGVEHLGG